MLLVYLVVLFYLVLFLVKLDLISKSSSLSEQKVLCRLAGARKGAAYTAGMPLPGTEAG